MSASSSLFVVGFDPGLAATLFVLHIHLSLRADRWNVKVVIIVNGPIYGLVSDDPVFPSFTSMTIALHATHRVSESPVK